jgi:ADP-ribose pyrophosphatase YjhB (NUDIX family)
VARFCSECGAALEQREASGRVRPVCPACGHVHFDDPKVAVGVVASRGGQILLTRRNHDPKMGCWSFPSGFVDAFEDVVAAAARETLEETGIEVTVGRLLGVFQEPGSRVVYLAFAAEAAPGEPVVGDECMDVRFFPADSLPEPAFHHDTAILRAWRETQTGL